MRTPVHTGQFRRDIRRAQKRGKDMSKLRVVLTLLIAAEPLPPRLKDHPLTGIGADTAIVTSSRIGCFSTRSTTTILSWPAPAAMRTCSGKLA